MDAGDGWSIIEFRLPMKKMAQLQQSLMLLCQLLQFEKNMHTTCEKFIILHSGRVLQELVVKNIH